MEPSSRFLPHALPTGAPLAYTLRVYGWPVAQGRGRAVLVGGHIRVFDPLKSRTWKQSVMLQASQQRPPRLLDGPLTLTATFYLPRPKSLPRRVQYPIGRPDLSNYIKGLEDALRSIIYRDDAQIVDLRIAKRYATEAEPPGVAVRVGGLDSND